jgi:hypothetical protein
VYSRLLCSSKPPEEQKLICDADNMGLDGIPGEMAYRSVYTKSNFRALANIGRKFDFLKDSLHHQYLTSIMR